MKIPLLYQVENFLRSFKKLWPIKYADPSFSQLGEDIFLREFFKEQKVGFYVDVGAHHPYRFSNTFLLYRRGWRGINIEPNPEAYNRIQKKRKRDINLNYAVSNTEGLAKFFLDDAKSGIFDEGYIHDKSKLGETIDVETKSLSNILDEHLPLNKEIDFISIDCEGHDINVILSNNWEKYRPKIVLVEDHNTNINSDIDKIMLKVGYRYYFRLSITKIYLESRIASQYISLTNSS